MRFPPTWCRLCLDLSFVVDHPPQFLPMWLFYHMGSSSFLLASWKNCVRSGVSLYPRSNHPSSLHITSCHVFCVMGPLLNFSYFVIISLVAGCTMSFACCNIGRMCHLLVTCFSAWLLMPLGVQGVMNVIDCLLLHSCGVIELHLNALFPSSCVM